MNLHLLIDYYKFTGPNSDRQVELDTCFIDNINNKNFYKVHVFSNEELPSTTKKIIHNKLILFFFRCLKAFFSN